MLKLKEISFRQLQNAVAEAWHKRNVLPDGSEEQDLLKRASNASNFYIGMEPCFTKALINHFLMYAKEDESLLHFAKSIAKGKFKP